MFSLLRQLRIVILTAALLLVSNPALADGGWIAFRNDTGTTLVIQEVVSVGTGSRSASHRRSSPTRRSAKRPPSAAVNARSPSPRPVAPTNRSIPAPSPLQP